MSKTQPKSDLNSVSDIMIPVHLGISFIALVCIGHLNYRLKLNHTPMSAGVVQKQPVNVQSSILEHVKTKERYIITSQPSKEAISIYKTMRIQRTTTPYKKTK